MNRTRKSYGMTILGAEYILQLLPPGILQQVLNDIIFSNVYNKTFITLLNKLK